MKVIAVVHQSFVIYFKVHGAVVCECVCVKYTNPFFRPCTFCLNYL